MNKSKCKKPVVEPELLSDSQKEQRQQEARFLNFDSYAAYEATVRLYRRLWVHMADIEPSKNSAEHEEWRAEMKAFREMGRDLNNRGAALMQKLAQLKRRSQ